ncbi:ABC transporter permease [Streptomyces sp. NBC_01102]|uniref:ABC transporter permease n=1 Tax=unclassified Streptomyces TaxID=2593676 RepID=UPI0038708D0C|nr:ABC transporter permease [Streptomyces sp. NBC_01102]
MNHRSPLLAVPRFLMVAWWIQIKIIATSAFDGFLQVVWPLFFATSAFLVYRVSPDPDVMVYAALGASMMGVWSAIATTASSALQRERFGGTLELMVSSPTPFALTLIPITGAMASLGLYSMGATLLWGWLVFDIPLHIASPVAFVACVLLSIISVSMVGFMLSVTVVRYRTAWALGNVLEYPGWLLCGFLVPLSMFPDWVAGISRVLPPTWAVQAIRESANGESPWVSLGICAALGLVYGIVAAVLSENILRSARRQATLSLT